MPRSTRFKTLPLLVAGGSYQSRSVPASTQRTVHFYPEAVPQGISPVILLPWPGLKLFASGGALHFDRGMHVFNDVLYSVSGSNLYSISSAGVKTSIGAIAGGSRTMIANNGAEMVVSNGLTPYSYNGTTLSSLSAITFNPRTVDYLNNQFIFDGDDGRFSVADVGLTTVDGANYATPESAPDDLVVPRVFNQLLYNYGTDSIEPWDNVGNGNPPFERMNGAIIEDVGALSPYAVTNTPDAMYFIGRNGMGYQIKAFQAVVITPPAIAAEFQTYTLTNVFANTITFDGQRFCIFTFPTDGKTWVYGENTGLWFELDHGANGGRYRGGSYAFCYNKHLFHDYETGDIYELDFDTYTNDGETIRRERTLSILAGETMGSPGLSLEMSKLRLSLETGTGLTTGQGQFPKIMVQASMDGGRTWGQETWLDTGTLGDFSKIVEWDNMQVFKQLVIRLVMTDPVKWVLYSASIDLREAGY